MTERELLLEMRNDIKDIQVNINAIHVLDATQNAQLAEHIKRSNANEVRINRLENFKWYFSGLAVLIVAVSKLLEKLI